MHGVYLQRIHTSLLQKHEAAFEGPLWVQRWSAPPRWRTPEFVRSDVTEKVDLPSSD